MNVNASGSAPCGTRCVCTKMPSVPSSASPTATRSPFLSRRPSRTDSVPSLSFTMPASIRGSRGAIQRPFMRTNVGRLVVEKNPSGKTPSAGAGANRASGNAAKRGSEKSGGGNVDIYVKSRRDRRETPRALQQRDRIPIERDAKLRLLRHGKTLEKVSAEPRQIARMFGLDQ